MQQLLIFLVLKTQSLISQTVSFNQAHFFAATGGTGRQVYGTCLTLWEPYSLKLREKKDANGSSKSNGTSGDGTQRTVFLPKCLVLLSSYPYLAAFREFLTQLNRLSKLGEMTLPIERYIINFCSEIPAPPPGSFEVQTTILDSVVKIWSPPHNLPIPWVSLPFSYLFECLDIDNIILVWHCLALERQVLITSTQLSLLTTACEVFLSLLFPMRWSHAYIPVLPHFLIPILSAPMPFLCGIIKTNLADALYDLSRDCVLVDLDKNTVTLGPDTLALPPLPPYQEANLQSQLEENAGMVFREARSLTRNDDYSESGQNLQGHIKMMAEAMWESKLMLYDEAFHLIFTPEQSRKNLLNGNDSSGMDSSDRVIP
jgi:DENN (AEX-3) domain